jgi:hypothetical protein
LRCPEPLNEPISHDYNHICSWNSLGNGKKQKENYIVLSASRGLSYSMHTA